jgi:hypothetical protein
MANLGEEGTEQFTVETLLDGKQIALQKLHDPFTSTTVTIGFRRWETIKQLLRPSLTKVQVIVRGSPSATARIMTMDPREMMRENVERERRASEPAVTMQAGECGAWPQNFPSQGAR